MKDLDGLLYRSAQVQVYIRQKNYEITKNITEVNPVLRGVRVAQLDVKEKISSWNSYLQRC